MAPQSSRRRIPAPSARRRWPAQSVRLRCEALEDRDVPALFNVMTPPSISGLTNAGCVAVADFDKNGVSDAVLTNFGTAYGTTAASGAGNTVTILYGRVGQPFGKVQPNTGGWNPSFAAVGDINGDGWTDLVVANENGQGTGTISVFKNDGAGNLSLVGTPFSTFSNNPGWVGLADVTGDHVLDVVVGSFGKDDGSGNNIVGNNVTIFQGHADAAGKGDFTYSSSPITTLTPAIQFAPTAMAVADFDGDGILDIAAAVPGVPADSTQPQPFGSVYVFKGVGAGGFAAPNQFDTGGALPVGLQAADLNNDGKPDLVVANAGDPNANPEFKDNSVGVILNVSSGGSLNFGITNSLTSNCYGTFSVAVADFDLNGKMDIAAVNYGAQAALAPTAFVSVYMGNGNGTFNVGSPATYDTQTNLPGGQYVAAGDFDGNGTPDLVVAHASNKVGELLNTSPPIASKPAVQNVTINDGSAQRSRVTSLTVTFSTTVTLPADPSTAFQLTRTGPTGTTGNVTVTVDLSGSTASQTVAKLTFSGSLTDMGSLMDGNYTLTVLSSKVTGMTADNVTNLYRLYGDTNGDRRVDAVDLFAFAGSYGKKRGDAGYLDYLDGNNDGGMDALDLFAFASRYGTTLVP